MRKSAVIAFVCYAAIALALLGSGVGAVAADAPHFGAPADPARIKAWDISIPPDGANLPPGHGSVSEGAETYAAKCQACHGVDGQGSRPTGSLEASAR